MNGDYEYVVEGIVWQTTGPHLPTSARVWVPDWLVLADPEDFRSDGSVPGSVTSDILDDDDDDDEIDEAAWEALDGEWDRQIQGHLEQRYGGRVVSIGDYCPAPGNPFRPYSDMSLSAVADIVVGRKWVGVEEEISVHAQA
jgi:hypothetical protein